MKTAVTKTSIDAYRQVDGRCVEVVRSALQLLGQSCIADLADYLGWDKSSVSGRLNDLKKAGEIVFVAKKPSRATGKVSEFWRVKQFNENLF